MPIGDLLAEISGEKPSPPPKLSSTLGIKRKADESNGDAAKATKTRHPDSSANKATRNLQGSVAEPNRPTTQLSRPAYTGTAAKKPSPQPHRTSSAYTNGSSRPSATNGQSTSGSAANGKAAVGLSSNLAQRKSMSDIASRPKLNPSSMTSKAPLAKPSPTTPTASDPSRAPKKGSFAEIMARASKAQEVRGKVGVIQHKATDKAPGKRDKEAPAKPGAKAPTGKPYLGNARPTPGASRDSRPGVQGRDVQKSGSSKDGKQVGKPRPGSSGGDTLEKKLKKSATATTGYTGTARPRLNAAKSASARGGANKPQGASRGGGLLAPPKPSRQSRYEEEYDDDLDDFIDYDDEDEPDPHGGGRGGYDSDASSDMEAGMTDIDEEERRATFQAIQEDKREQALEEKLRREKEERKKRLTQGRR